MSYHTAALLVHFPARAHVPHTALPCACNPCLFWSLPALGHSHAIGHSRTRDHSPCAPGWRAHGAPPRGSPRGSYPWRCGTPLDVACCCIDDDSTVTSSALHTTLRGGVQMLVKPSPQKVRPPWSSRNRNTWRIWLVGFAQACKDALWRAHLPPLQPCGLCPSTCPESVAGWHGQLMVACLRC